MRSWPLRKLHALLTPLMRIVENGSARRSVQLSGAMSCGSRRRALLPVQWTAAATALRPLGAVGGFGSGLERVAITSMVKAIAGGGVVGQTGERTPPGAGGQPRHEPEGLGGRCRIAEIVGQGHFDAAAEPRGVVVHEAAQGRQEGAQ